MSNRAPGKLTVYTNITHGAAGTASAWVIPPPTVEKLNSWLQHTVTLRIISGNSRIETTSEPEQNVIDNPTTVTNSPWNVGDTDVDAVALVTGITAYRIFVTSGSAEAFGKSEPN